MIYIDINLVYKLCKKFRRPFCINMEAQREDTLKFSPLYHNPRQKPDGKMRAGIGFREVDEYTWEMFRYMLTVRVKFTHQWYNYVIPVYCSQSEYNEFLKFLNTKHREVLIPFVNFS